MKSFKSCIQTPGRSTTATLLYILIISVSTKFFWSGQVVCIKGDGTNETYSKNVSPS